MLGRARTIIRPSWRRSGVRQRPAVYVGAAALATVAVAATLALEQTTGPTFFGLVLVAVAAAVWLGGLGPALVATAVTGVKGLTTVVPISPPTEYYDYVRSNGVVTRGNNYPSYLANAVTNPDRRAYCAPVRDDLAANDGDEHGDRLARSRRELRHRHGDEAG